VVQVIHAIGVVMSAMQLELWDGSEWSCCWQWVGAAIGGTQVEPILVVGGVGAACLSLRQEWCGWSLSGHAGSVVGGA
jgi:hypothetical protein